MKAVVNGALLWHIGNTVTSRSARYHYGTDISVPYDPEDPDHQGRTTHVTLSGEVRVDNAWSSIVKKVCYSFLSLRR